MEGKHPSYTSNLLSSHSKFYKQKSISPNDSIKSETPKQKLRAKIFQIPPKIQWYAMQSPKWSDFQGTELW